MKTEQLPDGHHWLRIALHDWSDPLDPHYAQKSGGRWNPPNSFPTLYLNEDLVTARLNLRLFIEPWPYEPEDLRDDTGPVLVSAQLPRHQQVVDVHTPAGVRAVGLPATYPLESDGSLVAHKPCQDIGDKAHGAGLRGVRCRGARTPDGSGRELAWFPATRRSRARRVDTLPFEQWFWS